MSHSLISYLFVGLYLRKHVLSSTDQETFTARVPENGSYFPQNCDDVKVVVKFPCP